VATAARSQPAPAPAAGVAAVTVARNVTAPTATTVTPAATPAARTDAGAATPDRAASGPVQLVITSRPAGARVTVDGVGWGQTPVTIRYLPAGMKSVRVTKDGYGSAQRSVRVSNGTSRVDVVLRPQ